MVERIKGSFPEVFKMYYDEIERGIRHQRGYIIKPSTEPADKIGWLTTGVVMDKDKPSKT